MIEFNRRKRRRIDARLAIVTGTAFLTALTWLGRPDSVAVLRAEDPSVANRNARYELVLANAQADATTLLQHGYQALKQQNYAQAIGDANRALEFDRNLPVAYMLRAYAYTASGREAEACVDHRQVLRLGLDPKGEIATTTAAALNELVNGWPMVICDELVRPMVESDALVPDDPSLAARLWSASTPGAPHDPRPVGGMNFNVLKYAVFNRQTGRLSLVGEIDPRWATGPIPYLELLQAGWSSPSPGFSLEPGPGEMERVEKLLQAAMRDLSWVTKLLRRAIQARDSSALEGLVQTNFHLDEAALAALRSQATQGNKLAAASEIVRRCHAMMRNEGLVLPPQLVDKYGGINTYNELKFAKVPADSQLARVLFEADYGLKQVINSPLAARQIKGFETRAQFVRRRDPKSLSQSDAIRYWFKIQAAPVKLADDRNRIIIRFETPQIAVNAVRSGRKGEVRVPVYTEYAKQLTSQYDEIARQLPQWHELREAVKVLTLVRMLNRQKISLAFPSQTWNPWKPPARVSPLVTATLLENPGGLELSTYTNIVAVSGGVDLANVSERINLVGMRDEQIKSIGSFFDGPSDKVELSVVSLGASDASVVDLRSSSGASAVETLAVPLLREPGGQRYRLPPLAPPPAPTGMIGGKELEDQVQRLSAAQLRRQLADLDRQLRALNQSVLNNQDELEQWAKEVEDAQRESFLRIGDAALGWVGYKSRRLMQADGDNFKALAAKYRQAADPAAKRKIMDEIKPIVKDERLLRAFSRTAEGANKISDVEDWIEKLGEKLKEAREKKNQPQVSAKDFELPVRQILDHLKDLDRFKPLVTYGPLIGETTILGKLYIDTAYDLLREFEAWNRIQEMDRNLPAYALAVSESQRRIVAIVNELKKRETARPDK